MSDIGGGSIVLAKFIMKNGCIAVESSLSIHDDFTFQVEFHGRRILPECFKALWQNPPSMSQIGDLVSALSTGGVCCGNQDEKFIPLIKRKGKFFDSSGMYI